MLASASVARAVTPMLEPMEAFSAREFADELPSVSVGSNSSTSTTESVKSLETVLVLLLESVEVATTVKVLEVLDS